MNETQKSMFNLNINETKTRVLAGLAATPEEHRRAYMLGVLTTLGSQSPPHWRINYDCRRLDRLT